MSEIATLGPGAGRIQRIALIAGVAGLALCALGAALDAQQFFRSYLFAYLFWLGIPLGSMVIAMLHRLTGGTWGYPIRHVQETAALTLPLLALLLVPLLFGVQALYPWARPAAASDPLVLGKSQYLSVPFFLVRAAIYFAVWIVLAVTLNRWSRAEERAGDPAVSYRLRLLSRGGLMLYFLTITFAMIDWAMSLEPDWFSTIYGLLWIAAQALAGLSFTIVVTALLAKRAPLTEAVSAEDWNDFGNLLLMTVMFWAYIAFSQFLIIWSGDLPDENSWYLHRTQGGWAWIDLSVIACQFGLPFLVLLAREQAPGAAARGTGVGCPGHQPGLCVLAGCAGVLSKRSLHPLAGYSGADRDRGNLGRGVHLAAATPVAPPGAWPTAPASGGRT